MQNTKYDLTEYKTETDLLQAIDTLKQRFSEVQDELLHYQNYFAVKYGNKTADDSSLESMFYLGSKNDGTFQIFGDKFGFERVIEADLLGSDATFGSSPSLHTTSVTPLPYDQIFTIHAVHICPDDSRVIEAVPCIWIAMAKGKKLKHKLKHTILQWKKFETI